MNDLMTHLKASAEQWAQLGAPALAERFVARNGQCFTGRALPKPFKRGTPKECYQNSAALSFDTGLRYVEGYVWRKSLPIPILHAWCLDDDGEVIDLTIERPEECQYAGVVLTSDECWTELQRLTHYGLIDTGMGLNARWMFEVDPGLKEEVDAIQPFDMANFRGEAA